MAAVVRRVVAVRSKSPANDKGKFLYHRPSVLAVVVVIVGMCALTLEIVSVLGAC